MYQQRWPTNNRFNLRNTLRLAQSGLEKRRISISRSVMKQHADHRLCALHHTVYPRPIFSNPRPHMPHPNNHIRPPNHRQLQQISYPYMKFISSSITIPSRFGYRPQNERHCCLPHLRSHMYAMLYARRTPQQGPSGRIRGSPYMQSKHRIID
jgi:hypothetical protein